MTDSMDTNIDETAGFLEGFGGDEPAEVAETETPTEFTEPEAESNQVEEVKAEETETEEAAETAETTEAPETKEAPAEKVLSLKFLDKNYDLKKEAAQEVAKALGIDETSLISTLQKGLNYDHAIEKAKDNPAMKVLDFYAKENGMSVDRYLQELDKGRDKVLFSKELAKLQEAHPEADEGLLNELAQRNVESRKQEIAKVTEEEKYKPWQDFYKEYPEIKPTDVPKEVMELVTKGESPVLAMMKVEKARLLEQLKEKEALQKQIEEKETQLKMLQNNEKNKKQDIGSVKSDAAAPTGEAALFLEGFNTV